MSGLPGGLNLNAGQDLTQLRSVQSKLLNFRRRHQNRDIECVVGIMARSEHAEENSSQEFSGTRCIHDINAGSRH